MGSKAGSANTTRCRPWLGQACPESPGQPPRAPSAPGVLPKIKASPSQGSSAKPQGRAELPWPGRSSSSSGPGCGCKSKGRKFDGGAGTSAPRERRERPRCQRRPPALSASLGKRGSLRDAQPLRSCSSPAEPDPRGPRDPPRPPQASSSLHLQHQPSSRRARAPAPIAGEGFNRHRPPPVRPLQISKRFVLLLLPPVPRARTLALKPSGLFLTQATQPGKNPLSALYLGRFGRRKARGHYRLKRHDPLSPTVIRQMRPGESRRQNGDGVKAAATARAGKNKTQGQGQTKDAVVLGGTSGCTPSQCGRENWGDARTEPVAFGVTQRPGQLVSPRRPANRTEGEGGLRKGWVIFKKIIPKKKKKNFFSENTTLEKNVQTGFKDARKEAQRPPSYTFQAILTSPLHIREFFFFPNQYRSFLSKIK